LWEVDCKGTKIVVAYEGGIVKKIAVSAREIYIYADNPIGPRLNPFKGTILEITRFSPSIVRGRVKVGENTFLAELPGDAFDNLDLTVGKETFIKLKLKSIRTYA